MSVRRVAVLGAGNGGRTVAADLALAGLEVHLYELPEFAAGFRGILDRQGITIVREGTKKSAKLRLATTEIRQAMEGVDTVLVVVPAFGHERLARVCAPYLETCSLVCLTPGGFGSYVFYHTLKELGVWRRDLLLAEMATLPYGTRISGDTEVTVYIDAICIPTGVFPARRTAEAISAIRQLYPVAVRAEDVLDAALNNLNPTVHTAPSILNSGRIEYASDFYLYREGMGPSVRRAMAAVDRERIAVREAAGFGEPHYALDPDNNEVFEHYFGRGGIEKAGMKMRGPLSLDHRFLTEDIPYGLVFFASLGRKLSVPTPVTDALINLACAIHGTDHWQEGRSLVKLSLDDVPIDELRRLLAQGE